MQEFVYLIPLFPLVSFAILAIFGSKLPKSITTFLAPGSILASFILAVLLFCSQISNNQAVTVSLCEWIRVGDFHADFSFLIDSLSIIFT